jgi:hypothetical protein
MANQYHDELGRFCSRNEMGEAVDRLFTLTTSAPTEAERAVASEQWFNLKNEYTALLAKPEPAEEKLEAFLNGEAPRQKIDDWDRAQMLLLLDKREGREARESMRKLLDETDFSDLPAARAYELFRSPKLSLEEKYEVALRSDEGLAGLVLVEPDYVLDGGERERALLDQISVEGRSFANNDAWMMIARRGKLAESRRAIIDAAKNEYYYGGYKAFPAAELGKNPNLTKEEAVEVLEVIAAHQPEQYAVAEKSMEEGPVNIKRLLNSYRTSTPNRDYKEFQTWRLNGFELEEQKAELAAFHAKIAAELPNTRWENPSQTTVLGLNEGNHFKALQARVDANAGAELDAQVGQLEKRIRSRAFKKELYHARDEAKRDLSWLHQRQSAAAHYRLDNESAAQLRAALSQKG